MTGPIEIARLEEPARSRALARVAASLPSPRPTAHLPCGCLAASLPPVVCDRQGVWVCLACTLSRRVA